MSTRRDRRAVVITDAQPSHDAQLRSRQVRYLVMMSIRAVCLIIASILVVTKPPLLAVWLVLCVTAMVLLPWLAVIIANDRPAKAEHRLLHRQHAATETPNALGAAEPPVVIDADPDDKR